MASDESSINLYFSLNTSTATTTAAIQHQLAIENAGKIRFSKHPQPADDAAYLQNLDRQQCQPKPYHPMGATQSPTWEFVDCRHRGLAALNRVPAEFELQCNFHEAAQQNDPQGDEPDLRTERGRGDQLAGAYDRSR